MITALTAAVFNEYAEDSMNTILDTTASTNFIANEINFR